MDTSKFDIFKRALPFWGNLTDNEKEQLSLNAKIVNYKKGSYLYNGETNCLSVIFILNGTLRTSIISPEGREITLYRLADHDFCMLSASCIFPSITFDVSVTAEADCELIQINANIYQSLMERNIYLESFTYRGISHRFSDVMWTMEQILFSSFDQRLATFLLEESEKQNTNTIALTHEEIALYMGSAREVVSRMLKYFEKEKMVTLQRGKVTIIDNAKLTQIKR